MSEKVKLPCDVVEAIKEFDRCEETNRDILAAILGNADSKAATTIREYAKHDVNFEYLLSALVNGYEVEMSKEERVAEYITRLRNTRDHSCTIVSQQLDLNIEIAGALQVLEYLDVKIEGVNT